jgi:hypothetical protein
MVRFGSVTADPAHVRAVAGLMSLLVLTAPVPANAQSPVERAPAPAVYSIDPAYGGSGEGVAIIGFGFSASNTVRFDSTSLRDVPIAWQVAINCVVGNPACHPGINQALVIIVPPDATVGPHHVSVESASGVSNAVSFTVTR